MINQSQAEPIASSAAVLVGGTCAGKTHLGSAAGCLLIESSELLLWWANNPGLLPTNWRQDLHFAKSGLTVDEIGRSIITLVQEHGPNKIGRIQADFLSRASEPVLLVGARYLDTIVVLKESGFPVFYIDPLEGQQTRRLAARLGVSEEEAGTIVARELERCQLLECRSIADVVVSNRYDARSETVARIVLGSLASLS